MPILLSHLRTCATVLALGCALPAVAQDANAPAVKTIASLDVPRYMGTWFEVARFPNRFQKKCVGYTRADYTLQTDGTVQVRNRCKLENGEMDEALGTAKQIGAATSPQLKVRFAPAWLSFIPAVWGDYWVIDLDEAYQLAAVSDSKREYLWILSRTAKVDAGTLSSLLERLRAQGFKLDTLMMTPQ